ncbi:hypothetical protein Tco_1246111 [Tanacetum coccineum]
MWDRLRYHDENVFDRLGQALRTTLTVEVIPTVETVPLAETVLVRDRLRGVEESYGDTHSSRGTRTKYRDRLYDEDRSRSTPRIRNFKSSRKTRMPNNVKTYDGTGDPEDHLKIFQAAAQVERWAMPTWCHMFNSTLIGAARVWFDELPPESIDGYKGLKAAFLAYFMQQKKYVKDPV